MQGPFISLANRFLPRLLDETPLQRDKLRRARLIRWFALILLIAALVSAPSTLVSSSFPVVFAWLCSISMQIIALLVNRLGAVTSAGICCIAGVTLGIVTPLIVAPISSVEIPILCLFIIPTILAVAILPTIWIFMVAALQCGLILLCFFVFQHTPDVTTLMQTSIAGLLIVPLILQAIIAPITFVLVNNLLKQIERADRAEEIAALQRDVAQRKQQEATNRQGLEASIQDIAYVHAQVARGNLAARASLKEGSLLWHIAGPLNNLLNRAQKWKQDAEALAVNQKAMDEVINYLRTARLQKETVSLQNLQTKTPIDTLLKEVQLAQIQASPPSVTDRSGNLLH